MKIKTGDTVRVMVGKDKGKEGKVMQTFPDLGLVVIEGVRQSVRHIGPKGRRGARAQGQEGQRVTYNAPIRVDNVALVHEKTTGRVGFKKLDDGKKVRVLRSKKGVQEIG